MFWLPDFLTDSSGEPQEILVPNLGFEPRISDQEWLRLQHYTSVCLQTVPLRETVSDPPQEESPQASGYPGNFPPLS